MPRRALDFPWISEVPYNPHLTLEFSLLSNFVHEIIYYSTYLMFQDRFITYLSINGKLTLLFCYRVEKNLVHNNKEKAGQFFITFLKYVHMYHRGNLEKTNPTFSIISLIHALESSEMSQMNITLNVG